MTVRPNLFHDLETYSDLDIKKVPLDRYASHSSTRILMCAFAHDEGPVEIWEEADGEKALRELQREMHASTLIPWNCAFERNLIRHCWKMRDLAWIDAMVLALYVGLPAPLKEANKAPWFVGQAQTTKEGSLISKFCKPNKAVHNRETDPEDWKLFKDYCKRDVFDTRLIYQWITRHFDFPDREYRAWLIDQAVNERGMPVDRLLTARAQDEAERLQEKAHADLQALTGLANSNSTAQLLPWLRDRGYTYTSLGKELVQKALREDPGTEGADVDD